MKILNRIKILWLIPLLMALALFHPFSSVAQEDTNDFFWLELLPPGCCLDSWSFEETNWDSDFGFDPASYSNILQVPDWDGNALQVDSTNAAWLAYNIVQDAPGYGNYTNLSLSVGSVEFWFLANWESADTNFYGSGPGDFGRFIEAGKWTTNAASDWWSLYLNHSGTAIYFSSGTNGVRTNYLSAPISWDWNLWHLVDLTFGPSNSLIYLDGQLAASGAGVRYVPSGNILTNGFSIGSDFATGMQQIHGQVDDLYTYNYQLSADDVADDYAEASSELPGNFGGFHPADDDPIPPGGTNGTGEVGFPALSPIDFGTNLWLQLTNAINNQVSGWINNSSIYVPYTIFSRPSLLWPIWSPEATFYGSWSTNATPFAISMLARSNLFLEARSEIAPRIVGAGNTTFAALRRDETVWTWGNGNYGQLGNGQWTNSATPVQVIGLSNVVAIAEPSDGDFTLALDASGKVWSWGTNYGGQLGRDDGLYEAENTPAIVPGLSNIVGIAGGFGHALALKSDGTVWIWGDNYFGELGDNNTSELQRDCAAPIPGLTNAMSGHTLPFNVYFAVRTWDKTKEGLCAKTNAIKNAINAMNSAQYYESTLPSTSKNLFFQTWPGWTWGKYEARKLYGETRYVADMLPFSATFTGHLETAEAIYEGAAHNLIGIKTFSGDTGNFSPQHAVLVGMSGTGKSVTICDLLTQTEGYFAYTVIIEEGLSYGIYTQTVDPNAKPIIIQPDGNITINYLDTKGLPLTPDHLSAATALVARMAGVSQQEDKQMLRQAFIAKFINLLYEDVYSDWSNKNSNRVLAVARHALALQRYRQQKMPAGATTLEAFADFRDWLTAHEDEALDFLSKPGEADVLKFLKDPNTAKEVRNVAFSYLKPEDFPTHRMLQELMYLDAGGAEKEQVTEIATLLLPWCREGNYGCLFDGISNLSLTGKIAHFELGYIPESAKELKTAAGFLITNDARKHIMTLPRAARKRNVYEEVARFLDIPGGEEIVKESYAQLRKFNCWNISIVQQYARFKQSRIRSAVFGNSRQFYLMRQNDRADLDDIAADIAIPEITRNAIMNYPLPDHQRGQKFSAFTYLHIDSQRPICGTVHNVASAEMLYCSSSSGEHFDKRARELSGCENIVEGIVKFSSQQTKQLQTT